MSDVMHGPAVSVSGRQRKAYLLALLSVNRLTSATLNRGDVFANQLLDPLLQISMARGVFHAARFARDTPALNSPREQVPSVVVPSPHLRDATLVAISGRIWTDDDENAAAPESGEVPAAQAPHSEGQQAS